MASNPTDLRLHVLELEERLKRAEEGRQQAEEHRQQAEERNRPTTLVELVRFGHTLLSLPLNGLEYSYVTNGIARVLLRVPYENPSTLYYFFCDPNRETEADFQRPST